MLYLQKLMINLMNKSMHSYQYSDTNIFASTKKRSESKKEEVKLLNGIEIDEYLISKHAEKTVIFSDFDPKHEIEKLSEKCEVYWFCFKRTWERGALKNFKGNFYRTQEPKDILLHLKNIKNKAYELKQRKSGEFGTMGYYGYDEDYVKTSQRQGQNQNPYINEELFGHASPYGSQDEFNYEDFFGMNGGDRYD